MTEAERIRRESIDKLSCAAANLRSSTEALDRAVKDARERRLSWNHIGRAVGISRQAARQRWGL